MSIKMSSKKEKHGVEQGADIEKNNLPEREPIRRTELESANMKNTNAKAAMARELEGMGLSPEAVERILLIDVAKHSARRKA